MPHTPKVQVRWVCICDCGKECLVRASALRRGTTLSCGCYHSDIVSQKKKRSNKIRISQLKFLYPLKTLAFTAFSPLRFGPFPSFFPLREEMRETFFRPSLQPYPAALRKFAWPLWWRGRKCSSWYLHQNVPATPAHPWVRLREIEGWSYMYASTAVSYTHLGAVGHGHRRLPVLRHALWGERRFPGLCGGAAGCGTVF